MKKTKANLVVLPGCEGCGKLCKYNSEIADPAMVAEMEKTPYGCNSKLQGFEVGEANG